MEESPLAVLLGEVRSSGSKLPSIFRTKKSRGKRGGRGPPFKDRDEKNSSIIGLKKALFTHLFSAIYRGYLIPFITSRGPPCMPHYLAYILWT